MTVIGKVEKHWFLGTPADEQTSPQLQAACARAALPDVQAAQCREVGKEQVPQDCRGM